MTDMQSTGVACNELVTNHPTVERGSPHIWPFGNSEVEKVLAIKDSAMTLPDQVKAEAVKTTVEGQKPQEMLAWVRACRHLPMFGRTGDPPKSRIIFATEESVSSKWKKEEGDEDQWVTYIPLEEVTVSQGDGSHERRLPTQEVVRPRASLGYMARQLLDALPKAEKEQGKGGVPMAQTNKALRRKGSWKDTSDILRKKKEQQSAILN